MKHPCQAVVIRLAPDPSSGEVLNIGVVLHAPEHRFLRARFAGSWKRLTEAFPGADAVHLRRVATAISNACDAGYSSQLALDPPPTDVTEAVRRIVPDDDASLLLSRPLSGLTDDPERTLGELFDRYVVYGQTGEKKTSRGDSDVWRTVASALRERGVLSRLQAHVVRGKHYEESFEHSWKNGHWHVARPLSLDLLDGSDILQKAAGYTGRIRSLDPVKQDTTVVLIVGLPSPSAPSNLREAADRGLGILREQLADEDIAEVLVESDASRLAERIADDLNEHDAHSAQ